MIGVYNYTVILTYLSMISAGCGIFATLAGQGHPYVGCFFLLFCGLCDAFDGKVARMKKNRTDLERKFGIQIDSLSDLVAFGVLPACIGGALIRRSRLLPSVFAGESIWVRIGIGALYGLLVMFALAALIRLGYYNVTEEERQKTEGGSRVFFTGLPVTSSALIFPMILLFDFIIPKDIVLVYLAFIALTGLAFLSKIQVRKPGTRGVLILIGIGVCEAIALFILHFFVFRP